jgi:hypothetical protein
MEPSICPRRGSSHLPFREDDFKDAIPILPSEMLGSEMLVDFPVESID